MKICHILPRILPGENGVIVGGYASNCVSLLLELKNLGVNVQLVAPAPEGSKNILKNNPINEFLFCLPYLDLNLIKRGFNSVYILNKYLKDYFKYSHYDIVHSHSGTYPYALATFQAEKNHSARIHSLYCPIASKGGIYGKWWDLPMPARYILNRLNKVVAVTENIYSSLLAVGIKKERLALVPMGIPHLSISADVINTLPKYYPNDPNITKLLYIGNASKEKGLNELIEAVKILLDRKIPIFLVAAIENQSKIKEYYRRFDGIIAKINRLGLGNHVSLHGLVKSIQYLLNESDTIIIPWTSNRGPSDYPKVAMEAMAMKKCVISTPLDGCKELLQNGDLGFLTDGYSSYDLADKIEYAIKNLKETTYKAEKAFVYTKRFNSRNIAAEMLTVYENILLKG